MQPTEHDYEYALQCLKQGGIVAYPTETFYGLAVDPENEQAITDLYALKKREEQKAISLIIPDVTHLLSLVSLVPNGYKGLMNSFWPGPLTLIFSARKHIPSILTGGTNTLALRVSSHPVAMKLAESWGGALTTTSANISGEEALATAEDVHTVFGDRVSCVLDGGPTPGGQGSTIVHCTDDTMECRIIREGVISHEQLSQHLPSHYTVCK
ncbi:translation factor SUA5 [Desulfocapsa sulfexigens DSM 10523]|uniref:L-threonylcarbamoyladenylate synthase n=1 Tax=Desulfocapsa sulfexigens (strain DSM 10523 / SB164P1) TaxID=1167006 RepID=M1P7T6_DESSD|nr:L-threonylcarbamoyladenylate synthase [Desulfocapsa sulfexigens]AGF79528.1 translation factor SUA5 [Desulfocapsa sulfexigens DSM 10523]